MLVSTGMMPALFLTLLLGACLYAALRGGAPERVGAAILILATAASAITLAASTDRYRETELATMWVDVAMTAAFVALAVRAQRYWPMWVAMVQIDLIAMHLIMFAPQTGSWSYWAMQALWSYPQPILLIIGTWRHQQRLLQYGNDPPWSYVPT